MTEMKVAPYSLVVEPLSGTKGWGSCDMCLRARAAILLGQPLFRTELCHECAHRLVEQIQAVLRDQETT